MKTVKATDLRPGLQQVTSRSITSVKHTQDNQVHVEWSDSATQVLQAEAEIEVEDA
jgi:hypothetical protein